MTASYEIVPVTTTLARQFVAEHHRHNEAPSVQQVRFAVGLELDGVLVGVLTAGRPVARLLADRFTLEVSRVCIAGIHPNANSRMYGAIVRAAKALGYRRVITYTLQSESGVSLRASGWTLVENVRVRSWANTKVRVRSDVTLWGERRNAASEPKYRWEVAI